LHLSLVSGEDGRMNKLAVFVPLLAALTPAQQSTYHDPGLKTVVQVAIVCRDIDATSKRWAAVLGVRPPRITTTKPGSDIKEVFHGRPTNGQAKLAFIKAGQVELEFAEPVGEGTSWKEFLDQHGEGVHHMAFQITNLDKTVKALGFPVLHSGRYDDNDGSYTYVDSGNALGVILELLHTDPKR
jgi:methylmalonyl-CoA/ethylmalonyl-CoA epimerase